EEARRLELVGKTSRAVVELPHDGRAVETVRNSLPHLDVVHRRARALMNSHVRDVERRTLQHFEPRITRQRRDLLWRSEVKRVDLTRLERADARLVFGDRANDELVELRLHTPVLLVLDQLDLLTAGPRAELERTRAGRM